MLSTSILVLQCNWVIFCFDTTGTKGVDTYVSFTVQLGHFLIQQAQRMSTSMSVLQCNWVVLGSTSTKVTMGHIGSIQLRPVFLFLTRTPWCDQVILVIREVPNFMLYSSGF